MSTGKSYEWRRQVMWGVVLIMVGITVFLHQMDLIELNGIRHYWPLILVVFGINKMVGYPTAKHFSSGLWLVFIGLWLFACFEHFFGMTFRNSWPIIIVASGVSMIIEPLIQKRFGPHEESGNEK